MKGKLLIFLILMIPAVADAHPAFLTGNRFVWAEETDSTGLIWFGAGPVADHTLGDTAHELSSDGGSYLWVMVNDTLFTNAAQGQALNDENLTDGNTSQIDDTLQTVWHRQGFDIVQNVYPVEFGISGTIVVSIEVVNHRTVPEIAQAQYEIQDAVDGISLDGAGARSLEIYPRGASGSQPGYNGADMSYPSVWGYPVPPFFMAFADTEIHKTYLSLSDDVGIGYLNDSMAPMTLGLVTPSLLYLGDYGYGWIQPSQLGTMYYGDYPTSIENQTMQWAPDTIGGRGKDSVALIARTCYGTGDFDVCYRSGEPEYGSEAPIPTITFYPHLLHSVLGKPVPSTFKIETLVFGKSQINATLSTAVKQSIIAPSPISGGGTSQSQTETPLYWTGLYYFQWTDSLFAKTDGANALSLSIYDSVYGYFPTCPLSVNVAEIAHPKPVGQIISQTGSYNGSECNTRCTQLVAYDTSSIQVPVLSVKADTLSNMTLSVAPNSFGSDSTYYTVCVVDSMENGSAVITLKDSVGDTTTERYEYCTIVDTLPPIITLENKYDTAAGPLFDISDNRPWDRGLDSIRLTNIINLRIDTSNPPNLNVQGKPTAWVSLVPIDAGNPQSLCIQATDLAGNSTDTCFSFAASGVSSVPTANISIDIYPDASDGLIISIHGAPSADVETFDVLGREVDRFRVNSSYDWQTTGLPVGTYIVRAQIGTTALVKQIVH